MKRANLVTVRLVLAIAGVVAAGCRPRTIDPCAGVGGACIGVQIAGAGGLTRIDGATIHIHTSTFDASKIANGSGALSLPAAVAVLMSPLANTTTVDVDVIGRL